MTAVRDRDVHAIPTPRLGGMAMFGGLRARRCWWPPSCRSSGRGFSDGRQTRARCSSGGGADLRCSASSTTSGSSTRSPSWPARCSPPASWSSQGVQMLYLPIGGLGGSGDDCAELVRPRPGRGHGAHDPPRGRHDQRGQLRRRPGRAGRRASSRSPPPRSSSSPTCSPSTSSLDRATTSGVVAAALIGMCLGLPAAQLQPGPDLHGRLRLDAARPAAGRRRRSP